MSKTRAAEWFAAAIADADARGSSYLADANAAAEGGLRETAEKLYAKGQYWLDRSNDLKERAEAAKSQPLSGEID